MTVVKQVLRLLTGLLLVLGLRWVTLLGANSSYEEFYLVFMEPHRPFILSHKELKLNVSVGNPTTAPAQVACQENVQIHIGNSSHDLQLFAKSQIEAHSSESFQLPNYLVLTGGATKHTQYACVTTNDTVIVLANMDSTKASTGPTDMGQISAAGFTVFAKSYLTPNSLVVTNCDKNSTCVFVVTAVEDYNKVNVSLRLTPEGTAIARATYRGKTYGDNDFINETLNKGESMQVSCVGCDMTGTLITARKQVAVFGGGSQQYGGNYKVVTEQTTPIEALGTTYVLPYDYSTAPANIEPNLIIIKVVLPRFKQSFTYNIADQTVTKTAMKDRELFVLQINRENATEGAEVVKIQSDNPVLVAEVFICGARENNQDVTLTLPLPVELWETSFVAYIPAMETNRSQHRAYISLLLPADVKPQWLKIFDEHQASVQNWTTYASYTMIWLEYKTQGMRQIICDNPGCKPFVGFVVNQKPKRASAYSLIPAPFLIAMQITTEKSSGNKTTVPAATTASISTATYSTTAKSPSTEPTPPSTEPTSPSKEPLPSTEPTSPSTEPLPSTEPTSPSTEPLPSTEPTSPSTEPLPSTEPTSPSTEPLPSTEPTSPSTEPLPLTEPTSPSTEPLPSTEPTSSSTPCPPLDTKYCPCYVNDEHVSDEEKEAAQEKAAAEIKEELLVDRTKLSSYIRSKTSAPNHRTSPKVVGATVGVCTCVIVVAFIFASDAIDVMRALSSRVGLKRRDRLPLGKKDGSTAGGEGQQGNQAGEDGETDAGSVETAWQETKA